MARLRTEGVAAALRTFRGRSLARLTSLRRVRAAPISGPPREAPRTKPRVRSRGSLFPTAAYRHRRQGMEGRGCIGPLNNYLRLQAVHTFRTGEPPPSLARPS